MVENYLVSKLIKKNIKLNYILTNKLKFICELVYMGKQENNYVQNVGKISSVIKLNKTEKYSI